MPQPLLWNDAVIQYELCIIQIDVFIYMVKSVLIIMYIENSCPKQLGVTIGNMHSPQITINYKCVFSASHLFNLYCLCTPECFFTWPNPALLAWSYVMRDGSIAWLIHITSQRNPTIV